uniref:Tetraspanin n=1 Tax=Myripristis murdjan TaxID=586833 RepID=A0A668AXQ2_9TELE
MCCSGFLKTMMFIFNGCIFLAGAAILGVGVWVKVDSSSMLDLLGSLEGAPPQLAQLANVSYLLMAAGAVLLVIGFLGCCGAIKESKCMLLTFFIIVLIIFLAEVAGACPVLSHANVTTENVFVFNTFIFVVFFQLKCCGYRNYTNFDDSPFHKEHGGIYPDPCCNTTITDTIGVCSDTAARLSMIDGCFNKLLQLIKDNALIIAGVALGISALEVQKTHYHLHKGLFKLLSHTVYTAV